MSVIILDFKGQYSQLIARRVRDLGVFSKILPGDSPIDEIKNEKPEAIILTGGPDSVYEKDAIHPDEKLFEIGVPILGICYGAQLMSYMLGGNVKKRTRPKRNTEKQLQTTKNLFSSTDSNPEQFG